MHLAERALTDSEPAAMGSVLFLAAKLGLLRYNPYTVATYSRALAEIVSRYDLPAFWAGAAEFCHGWTRWLRSEDRTGLAEMRRGTGIRRELRHVWFLAAAEAVLAEAEASAVDRHFAAEETEKGETGGGKINPVL